MGQRSSETFTVVGLGDRGLPVSRLGADTLGREPAQACRKLRERFEIDLVCLTRGERGSLLVCAQGEDEHPGFPVTVADTVGAGDAFTVVLAHHRLRGSTLARTNEAANRYGAWVVSQPGATPRAPAELLRQVAG